MGGACGSEVVPLETKAAPVTVPCETKAAPVTVSPVSPPRIRQHSTSVPDRMDFTEKIFRFPEDAVRRPVAQ